MRVALTALCLIPLAAQVQTAKSISALDQEEQPCSVRGLTAPCKSVSALMLNQTVTPGERTPRIFADNANGIAQCPTDATVAFQAMLNGAASGSTVVIPAATCVLASTASVPSGVTLLVQGTLRQKAGTNANFVTNAAAATGVVIDGADTGSIDSNSNTYAFGEGVVWLSQCTDCIVERLTLNAQAGATISTRPIFRFNKTSGGSLLFTNGVTEGAMLYNRNTRTPAGSNGNAFTINDTATPSRYARIIGNSARGYSRICIEIVNSIGGGTVEYTYDQVIGNECDTTENPGGGFPWGISSSISGGNVIAHNHINIPTAQGNGIEMIGPDNLAEGNVIAGGANGFSIDGTGDAASSTYRLTLHGNAVANPGTRCFFAINGIQDVDMSRNSCSITNGAQVGLEIAASASTKRFTLTGNTFVVATTNVADSIYCWNVEGTDIKIIGNDCKITFAAAHADQSAIRVGGTANGAPDLVISGNTLRELSAQLGQGILAFTASADRWKIGDNAISGFSTGISLSTGTPILYDNGLSGNSTNYSVNSGVPSSGNVGARRLHPQHRAD